jgi:hypothetical protein
MWAVGGINVGQDSIMHYIHGKWHHITSPALRGLQFSQILALTSGNVWTVASSGGAPGTFRLLQLRNGRWVRHALPSRYDPIDIVADGRGGLDPGVESLALIKGTRSLWGAGATAHKQGFEAAIYANGPVR